MRDKIESDLFTGIFTYCKDLVFEDTVQDEILIRERADENESLENLIFEYGLVSFVDSAFAITHPELARKNVTHPLILKDMKKLVKYLKSLVSAFDDCCGEDDVLNTIPAKKAYKRAKRIYKHFGG